jgi:hypothetical protein
MAQLVNTLKKNGYQEVPDPEDRSLERSISYGIEMGYPHRVEFCPDPEITIDDRAVERFAKQIALDNNRFQNWCILSYDSDYDPPTSVHSGTGDISLAKVLGIALSMRKMRRIVFCFSDVKDAIYAKLLKD